MTIELALKILSEKYGAPFTDYVYEGKTGKPKGFLQFLVNSNSTSTMNGLQTELQRRGCAGYPSASRRRLKIIRALNSKVFNGLKINTLNHSSL